MDIEASLQGDGMTVGVFGPGQWLGCDGGTGIIEGIVELLMGLA